MCNRVIFFKLDYAVFSDVDLCQASIFVSALFQSSGVLFQGLVADVGCRLVPATGCSTASEKFRH